MNEQRVLLLISNPKLILHDARLSVSGKLVNLIIIVEITVSVAGLD